MSKQRGSPRVTVRITPLILASVNAEIERLNLNPLNEPWNMTAFINAAIVEKIAHSQRSRKKRRKQAAMPQKSYTSS